MTRRPARRASRPLSRRLQELRARGATLEVCSRIALALLLGVLATQAAHAADPAYTIESLNAPIAEFVTTGDTVAVKVTGPSNAAILRTGLRLNGQDVTAHLAPDGAVGSLTGTIPGLQVGVNTFELFKSPTSTAELAELTVIRATLPTTTCAALAGASLPVPDTVITSTVVNANGATSAAGVPLPEHCVVRGTIEGRIGIGPAGPTPYGTMFELRLPTNWNGRFIFQGQGGTGGSVAAATGQSQMPPGNPPPLAAGWAVVSFDGGHQGGGPEFGLDPKAKTDFAYHSMDIAAVTAKALIAAYYAEGPRYSYFSGCSNGGRQGMMFSQRFPTYFDGIINGSATYRLSVTYVDSSWGLQQLTAVAPPNAAGAPIMANAFSNTDLALIASDILAVCDGKDGALDGMVLNTSACTFRHYDPARLQCAGDKTPTCLTAGQVEAMRNSHRGARNSQDEQLYNVWHWDPGVAGAQWRSWKLGTSMTATPNAIKFSFCSTSVGYLYLTPPVPGFDCLTMDFDTDPARLAENSFLDADNPDLRAFRANGGKILWYHGTNDPSTPATETIRYLENMTAATTGSAAEAAEFARAFVVPGFGHCNGGSGLDRFDPLTPMVKWVEKGIAPEVMIATGNNFTGRSRPLCVYPKTAWYNGTGSLEEASSFSCRVEAPDLDGDGRCVGFDACTGNTGPVGNGACVGESACRDNTGAVARESCHDEASCLGNAGSVAEGACNGLGACSLNAGPVGKAACVGLDACIGNSAAVGEASCVGESACDGNDSSIGKLSCRGGRACMTHGGPVGDNACVGTSACEGSGPGAIGKGACRGDRACFNNPGPVGAGECVGPPAPATGMGVCER
jgi:feruloyl esterase